jgi:phenylalanine-4-hydroxylase
VRRAIPQFLDGLSMLQLDPDPIPRLDEVNGSLAPLTVFRTRAVTRHVPSLHFLDCLRNREFPITVTIRHRVRRDYLPEPDIFHDVTGHVPMHTGPAFASALVRFGDCAHTAAEIAASRPECLVKIVRR